MEYVNFQIDAGFEPAIFRPRVQLNTSYATADRNTKSNKRIKQSINLINARFLQETNTKDKHLSIAIENKMHSLEV